MKGCDDHGVQISKFVAASNYIKIQLHKHSSMCMSLTVYYKLPEYYSELYCTQLYCTHLNYIVHSQYSLFSLPFRLLAARVSYPRAMLGH